MSLLSGVILNQGAGTIVYGLELSALIALGGAIYFGILFVLDPKFRALANSVL